MSGLLDRLLGRRAAPRASGTYNPAQWLIDWISGGKPTAAGIAVSPDSALRLAAVYACMRVIAEDVAKVPLHLYARRPDGGRARADDHPSARLIRRPNAIQAGMGFRETVTGCGVLRGAGFAEIRQDRAGDAVALLPLSPDRVETLVTAAGDEVGFRVRRPNGEADLLPADRMLWLRGLTLDGVTPLSPIAYHRETIALGLAATQHGARQFANDISPGVFLKAQPGFHFADDDDRNNFVKAIKAARTGEHKYDPLPLEWGFEPVTVGMTNEDAQYIEGQKFNRGQIASIFRVPPHKIGDLDKATFSNIEHQAIEYVVDTLLSWFRRWEELLDNALLTDAEREVYFFEHKIDGLLRGDIKQRYEAYKVGREAGFLSKNDVRRFENLDPLPPGQGGDDYRSLAELQNAAARANPGGNQP